MGGESSWAWDVERLRLALEEAGFDADVRDAALPEGGGSLTARRERAGQALLLTIDAGGRFKATATRLLDEQGRLSHVAGRPARIVTEVTETTTVIGTLAGIDEVEAILAFLDRLGRAGGESG